MQIIFNTDNRIDGHDGVASESETLLAGRLERFSERLSRVEVHVADLNGPRGGSSDIRCTIEARPNGGKPLAVSAESATLDASIRDASAKLVTLLDREFGKQRAY